jgi:hypothetical protein
MNWILASDGFAYPEVLVGPNGEPPVNGRRVASQGTCGTCRHWVEGDYGWVEVVDSDFERDFDYDRLPDHGQCSLGGRNYQAQRDHHIASVELVFYPRDSEAYGAALTTRRDFGCNQWV